MPLSPRFARHFPRSRGQLTTKEERIRIFIIYKYAFSIISCRILRYHPSYCGSVLLIRILPPLKNDGTGELRSGVGLNTGLSFLNEVKNLGIGCKSQMILTCVRKHAPIASQARHFPPSSGEADTKEKEIIVL